MCQLFMAMDERCGLSSNGRLNRVMLSIAGAVIAASVLYLFLRPK